MLRATRRVLLQAAGISTIATGTAVAPWTIVQVVNRCGLVTARVLLVAVGLSILVTSGRR